jgi:FkbM family methyltransferase
MNNIQTQNNCHVKAYDRVLHLGAGVGATAPFYETIEYSQLVLVEVSTELVERLAKKFSRDKAVRIINRAVSAKEQQVDINVYSNPRFGSQLQLADDFLLVSNVRLKNRECLDSITFDELISEVSLDVDKANLLIVELNGYEVQFLRALRLDQFNMFDEMIVGLLNTNRYHHQSTEADLLSIFEKNGYLLREIKDSQYRFEKDKNLTRLLIEQYSNLNLIEQLKLKSNELSEVVQDLTQKRDEQAHRAESLQRQLEAQAIEAEQKYELMRAEIASFKAESIKAGEEIQKLTRERDEQAHWHQENKRWAESLKAQLESQTAEVVNLNTASIKAAEELQKLIKERDEQAHWHQENKKWAESLKAQLESQTAEVANLKAASIKAAEELQKLAKERDEQAHLHQKHKDWTESLKREIETLKKEYAEGERAQSLALKLQAKAQVDLEHLRAQYQQKLQQEKKLIELIQELQLKLQAAANYYHQLQQRHPELDVNTENNTIDAEVIDKPIESKRIHKKRKQDRS